MQCLVDDITSQTMRCSLFCDVGVWLPRLHYVTLTGQKPCPLKSRDSHTPKLSPCSGKLCARCLEPATETERFSSAFRITTSNPRVPAPIW